jgi:hypothetical protein
MIPDIYGNYVIILTCLDAVEKKRVKTTETPAVFSAKKRENRAYQPVIKLTVDPRYLLQENSYLPGGKDIGIELSPSLNPPVDPNVLGGPATIVAR